MRIRPFEYHAAESLGQALEVLDQYGSDVKVLAGGTDLILALKEKKLHPPHLLNVLDLEDLNGVTANGSVVRIGALTRHAALAANPVLGERAPALAEAVGLIGSMQIRNMATVGGNLCNASPAADSAPPLLAMDARAVLADAGGEKEIPLSSFFTGPGTTALKPNQMLKEIVFNVPSGRSAGRYLKLMRKRAVDLSVVGVAFLAEVDESGEKLARVSIALGGVAPTPIRAPEAEALLTGLSREEALGKIPEAARAAVDATQPITDVRASAEYRRTIVEAFVRRGAENVLETLF